MEIVWEARRVGRKEGWLGEMLSYRKKYERSKEGNDFMTTTEESLSWVGGIYLRKLFEGNVRKRGDMNVLPLMGLEQRFGELW